VTCCVINQKTNKNKKKKQEEGEERFLFFLFVCRNDSSNNNKKQGKKKQKTTPYTQREKEKTNPPTKQSLALYFFPLFCASQSTCSSLFFLFLSLHLSTLDKCHTLISLLIRYPCQFLPCIQAYDENEPSIFCSSKRTFCSSLFNITKLTKIKITRQDKRENQDGTKMPGSIRVSYELDLPFLEDPPTDIDL